MEKKLATLVLYGVFKIAIFKIRFRRVIKLNRWKSALGQSVQLDRCRALNICMKPDSWESQEAGNCMII